jgi:hypothetical protein
MTMNNELARNASAGPDRTVCLSILATIAEAQSAKDLHRIARDEIMSSKVMNEDQRIELWEAVSKRFCALNAAALEKTDPRWK